jgi:hypothetical protein
VYELVDGSENEWLLVVLFNKPFDREVQQSTDMVRNSLSYLPEELLFTYILL